MNRYFENFLIQLEKEEQHLSKAIRGYERNVSFPPSKSIISSAYLPNTVAFDILFFGPERGRIQNMDKLKSGTDVLNTNG